MALRGKKPKPDETRRIKMLVSGESNAGKTTLCMQMPKPYIIDGEHGTTHYGDQIAAVGGAVFHPANVDDIIDEVRNLMTTSHDFLTLAIDPITTPYHALADVGARKVGTEFHKHYKQYADKEIRRLMSLLSEIDMNVVITAHAKPLWGTVGVGKDGNPQPGVIGVTFDGYGKLDYMTDLYLQLDQDRETRQRYATVWKTRFPEFPDMDRFKWSYDALAERFGRERMEQGTVNIALATPEQIEQFNSLMNAIGEDGQKALKIDKAIAGVEDIADLPETRITKGIEIMERYHKTVTEARKEA